MSTALNIKNNHYGGSLIELIIYVGLLGVILLVIAQLFVLVSTGKVSQMANDDINISTQRIYQDISHEVIFATTIDGPAYHNQSNQLSLNSGRIIYGIDDTGRFVKTFSGQNSFITEEGIIVEDLVFKLIGPSSIQPTLLVDYRLNKPTVNSESHQTFHFAITVR